LASAFGRSRRGGAIQAMRPVRAVHAAGRVIALRMAPQIEFDIAHAQMELAEARRRLDQFDKLDQVLKRQVSFAIHVRTPRS
jgi:hypothetical protein